MESYPMYSKLIALKHKPINSRLDKKKFIRTLNSSTNVFRSLSALRSHLKFLKDRFKSSNPKHRTILDNLSMPGIYFEELDIFAIGNEPCHSLSHNQIVANIEKTFQKKKFFPANKLTLNLTDYKLTTWGFVLIPYHNTNLVPINPQLSLMNSSGYNQQHHKKFIIPQSISNQLTATFTKTLNR